MWTQRPQDVHRYRFSTLCVTLWLLEKPSPRCVGTIQKQGLAEAKYNAGTKREASILLLRENSAKTAIKFKLAIKWNWKIHQEIQKCVSSPGGHKRTASSLPDSSLSPTSSYRTPLSHDEVFPRLEIHSVGSWIAPHQQTDKFDYSCQIKPNRVIWRPALGGKLKSEPVQMSKGSFLSLLKTQRREKFWVMRVWLEGPSEHRSRQIIGAGRNSEKATAGVKIEACKDESPASGKSEWKI